MTRASWMLSICFIVACRPSGEVGPQEAAGADSALVVDSARFTVSYFAGLYRARIGYAFTNRTNGTVSLAHCRSPTPPVLEKEISAGNWVPSYSSFSLACLTIPPFRIAAGVTYRDSIQVMVAPHGTSVGPALAFEEITGTYRLRWELRAGPDPSDSAPIVRAFSPRFEMRRE